MSVRSARLALLLLVVVGVVALAVAARQTERERRAATVTSGSADTVELPVLAASAPTVEASGWLNTPPLTSADLRDKVVLYDFWTFGCINCRNTLPWVKAWDERYRADGLVLLSVHTPEFAHEADPAAVARFVADEGIRYPVALDPDRRTWRAFENRYWPAFYLHDRDGRRRYVHFGEGRYAATEDAIRSLLGVDPASPRAVVVR